MPAACYVPIDLGASSGRHLAVQFDGQRLELEEVYRFENNPIAIDGQKQWDLPKLWKHVQDGLRTAREKYAGRIKEHRH